MDLRQVVEQYHTALSEFSRGDAVPVKEIFSHRDDVTLADPFGPAVRGWQQVSAALDYAVSEMREGEQLGIERIAEYETPDLATILEVERYGSEAGDRADTVSFDLCTTSTFRREDGAWRLVHRHVDPIATLDANAHLAGCNT